VPVSLCARRGCPSYAVPGARYCSPACIEAVRAATAQHRSPYAPGFIERVQSLLVQGLSRGQVGDALGCTKNVVVGIINRHLKPRAPASAPRVVKPKPAKPAAKPAKQPRVPSRREVADRLKAEALREAAGLGEAAEVAA
jgi:hypothetical protein